MKRILLFFLILISTQSLQSQCSPSTANIYSFNYNSHHYEIVKENLSWVDAAACAVTRGGKLAEINSQQEQDTLFYHINNAGISAANTVAPDGGGASYLWIGGNDMTTEGKWVWDGDNDGNSTQFWQGTKTGSAVNGLYSNWGNEPDNWNNQDGLGLAFTDWPNGIAGHWNDVFVTNQLYYVIEYNSTAAVSEIKENEFSIYPNPNNGNFSIAFKNAPYKASIEIYNLLGENIYKSDITNPKFEINLEDRPKGLYLYKLHSNDGILKTGKVIIE